MERRERAAQDDDNTENSESGHPLIEMGWMLVGHFNTDGESAVLAARDALLDYFRTILPHFDWQMPVVRYETLADGPREEPVQLFDIGVTERNLRGWDFGVIVTRADLVSHDRPSAFAVFSSALGMIAFSTFRIAVTSPTTARSDQSHISLMARRAETLVLHSFGHLVGLEHEEPEGEPTNCMCDLHTVEELDHSQKLSEAQVSQIVPALTEIADRRLEELPEMQRALAARFYVLGAWRNRREIVQAVWRAEPWLFPIRLSRLATAAISALVILILTAESWELGMSLSASHVIPLGVTCLLGTTAYVIVHQRLLVRRQRPGANEQKVIANTSTLLIVLFGMLTTFVFLFALTLTVSLIFFNARVVSSWAASVEQIGWPQYLSLGTLVASVGLVIGALGASFEDQQYFRHVTFVDEEI